MFFSNSLYISYEESESILLFTDIDLASFNGLAFFYNFINIVIFLIIKNINLLVQIQKLKLYICNNFHLIFLYSAFIFFMFNLNISFLVILNTNCC